MNLQNEQMKLIANEIFGVFTKYKEEKCTYDRALEDASNIINKYVNERPIVGYVNSKKLKEIFSEIIENKKINSERNYIFDCKIHQYSMGDIERMYNSLNKI